MISRKARQERAKFRKENAVSLWDHTTCIRNLSQPLCATFSLDFEITFRRNHFHKKQGESVCEEGDRAYAKIMTLVS